MATKTFVFIVEQNLVGTWTDCTSSILPASHRPGRIVHLWHGKGHPVWIWGMGQSGGQPKFWGHGHRVMAAPPHISCTHATDCVAGYCPLLHFPVHQSPIPHCPSLRIWSSISSRAVVQLLCNFSAALLQDFCPSPSTLWVSSRIVTNKLLVLLKVEVEERK